MGQIWAYDVTACIIIQNGGRGTGSTNYVPCAIDGEAVANDTTLFSGIVNAVEMYSTQIFVGIYAKFNMAAMKPELVITYVVLYMANQFQMIFLPCFGIAKMVCK